jgi:hypothetical protein
VPYVEKLFIKRGKLYMFNIKKIICLSLVLVMGLSVSNVTFIKATSINEVEAHISQMTDKEFDEFLINYISTNTDAGMTESEIQDNLLRMGIELGDINTVSYLDTSISDDSIISPMYISPTKATIKTTIAKVANQSTYRIYTYVTLRETESDPGALDLLSIEWDPNVATYSKNDHDSYYTSYMDGSQSSKGIIIFNIDDNILTSGGGNLAYGSVYVTPKKSATLKTYSKYIHTYSKNSITWTIGGNITYGTGGLAGGSTFSLTGTTVPDNWQIAADGSINVVK